MSSHKLPELGYAYDALVPYIDAKTMEIHHSKHHNAYITNLNNALEQAPKLQGVDVNTIVSDLAMVPEPIRTAVQNNGGGHYNHSLFWSLLSPGKQGKPLGELAGAINSTFGSFNAFKEAFNKAAVTRFGSGWAWLSLDKQGALQVNSTANQDNPLMEGRSPILGLDVWEHAYYLNYQNRRPEYVEAWWNVVNWERAEELYTSAK
jgi:superoxide dismutase, Fe-Mn family